MNNVILAIFKTSAPLVFAMIGALLTEYTGTLAVFMEGAICFSAFISAMCIISTGSKIIGFLASTLIVMIIIFLFAVFTNKFRANPFLVGLSINIFAEGICSFYLSSISTSRVIAFENYAPSQHITSSNSILMTLIAIMFVVIIFLFFKYTAYGIRLRYVGQYETILRFNGLSCEKYKIVSWTTAAFFASCSGNALLFRLAAYSHGMSFGKGWLAILAVFLGLKNPILALVAVFIFSSAEYSTNILQSKVSFSPTLMLALPYILSFLLYTLYKIIINNKNVLD